MEFFADGWLDAAKREDTGNFYSQDNPRNVIVMHYTASYNLESAVNTFKSRSSSASAHFIVDVNGDIVQMVSTRHCGWHAGRSNYNGRSGVNMFSVGIEIVNPGYHFKNSSGDYLNWNRNKVSASKLKPFDDMIQAQDSRVGSATQYWPGFPGKQLEAVENLTLALLRAYPSIQDIVSHREIDTNKIKVDPGPAFPMRRFKMLLDRRNEVEGDDYYEMQVHVPGSTLNVRGGPGTGFERLSWGPLKHGELVQVIGRNGDWHQIQQQGDSCVMNQGWVYGYYLRAR